MLLLLSGGHEGPWTDSGLKRELGAGATERAAALKSAVCKFASDFDDIAAEAVAAQLGHCLLSHQTPG